MQLPSCTLGLHTSVRTVGRGVVHGRVILRVLFTSTLQSAPTQPFWQVQVRLSRSHSPLELQGLRLPPGQEGGGEGFGEDFDLPFKLFLLLESEAESVLCFESVVELLPQPQA